MFGLTTNDPLLVIPVVKLLDGFPPQPHHHVSLLELPTGMDDGLAVNEQVSAGGSTYVVPVVPGPVPLPVVPGPVPLPVVPGPVPVPGPVVPQVFGGGDALHKQLCCTTPSVLSPHAFLSDQH